MLIYVDENFHCHSEAAEGRTEVECGFFDGREVLIPLYRFVPDGETWTREDGQVFVGEMAAPIDAETCGEVAANMWSEKNALEIQNADMQAALDLLGVAGTEVTNEDLL